MKSVRVTTSDGSINESITATKTFKVIQGVQLTASPTAQSDYINDQGTTKITVTANKTLTFTATYNPPKTRVQVGGSISVGVSGLPSGTKLSRVALNSGSATISYDCTGTNGVNRSGSFSINVGGNITGQSIVLDGIFYGEVASCYMSGSGTASVTVYVKDDNPGSYSPERVYGTYSVDVSGMEAPLT